MEKMSQCEKIHKYMLRHGTITQREALGLGCYRLASRICDLRKDGIKIKAEMKEVKNADGSKSHIAVYSLVNEEGVVDV